MRCVRLIQLTVPLALLLALPLLAQAPTDNVLTNADVVKMVKAGLPERIILREIQLSRTEFSTSPAALMELKKQGVSEGILGAVLDSRMGTGNFRSEPPPASHAAVQSPALGPHHMPSFEAAMKINSTANGKLFVGHNQIKVERSGVPLFTLKWKEIKNTSSSK
ncbi:MAG: hypothetical protein WCC92_14650 [Candidatus Korobacteraceae bacterium]